MIALCGKQTLIHQKSQHLALNDDPIVICRYALKLNQICFIIDEHYNYWIEPEQTLNWLEMNNDTIVFFWAALQQNFN